MIAYCLGKLRMGASPQNDDVADHRGRCCEVSHGSGGMVDMKKRLSAFGGFKLFAGASKGRGGSTCTLAHDS